MSRHLLIFCNSIFAFVLSITITLKVTAQPTISSFAPASGMIGTSVIISGTNFNAVPANNIVFFGAVKATVTLGSTTALTVTVPGGATYQPLSVLDNATGLSGYSSKPFIVTFVNPAGPGMPVNFYKPKVDFNTATNPHSVAIGDLDGDGRPDMVVANSNSNTLSVLQNISSPGPITGTSFAAKVDFATGTFTSQVAIGDVDGDGNPDLVVVNNNNVSILRNTPAGVTINPGSFAAKVDFDLVFTGPVFVAIGDLDGDGKPDLAVANPPSNNVSVLRNTSTPGVISLAPKVNFATGFTPFSVAIGDIDGDGKPELVVPNAAAGANSISVLRNTSTPGTIVVGSFAAKVDFTVGLIPRSVAIGDIDGDGKADVVAANSQAASTNLSVLRNTSTAGSITAGSFALKVDFTTGTSPYSVAVGDADGDGKIDMMVVNQNSNTISVLRNTSTVGNITAAAKIDFATGTLPYAIAHGDLDRDGLPEIAVANSSSNSVSVFQINANALPVSITNVKAYQKSAGVQVEWTTQQESNLDRYEIERSQTGQQFFSLGTVVASGNSRIVTNYNWFDPAPLSGLNFYRIKIIDNPGQVTYSQVMKVNIAGAPTLISVYPNPILNNTVVLQMNNLQKGAYTITLINKAGQQVAKKIIEHAGGSAIESVELAKTIAAGVYQLRFSGEAMSITMQIIKK